MMMLDLENVNFLIKAQCRTFMKGKIHTKHRLQLDEELDKFLEFKNMVELQTGR